MIGARCKLNERGRRHHGGSRCTAEQMAARHGTIVREHPAGAEWYVLWDGCKRVQPIDKRFVDIASGAGEKLWQPKSRNALDEAYAAAMRWQEQAIVPEHHLPAMTIQCMVDWALAAYERTP